MSTINQASESKLTTPVSRQEQSIINASKSAMYALMMGVATATPQMTDAEAVWYHQDHTIETSAPSSKTAQAEKTAHFTDYTNNTKENTTQTEQVEEMKAPDYVSQAPEKLKEYYPNYTEHFAKIFEVVKNTHPEVIRVINEKLKESLGTFSEDIKTDKDKRTAVLMFMEIAYPDTKFTKENEQLDADGLDMRQVVATETLDELNYHFKKKGEKVDEEDTKSKEELQKVKEEVKATEEKLKATEEKHKRTQQKLEEVKAQSERVNKKREETIEGTERLINEIDPQLVKIVPQVQELVRYYEKLCKENGRTPIPKAQKMIDMLPEHQKKK